MNENRTILDLCGGSGAWSKPYRDAGYNVILVTLPDDDVRGWHFRDTVHGVLAAPPCDHFSVSGARWWADKDKLGVTAEHVETARACLRIIRETQPFWWALENPVGRIASLIPELGEPLLRFQPYEYGDCYSKKTCLWGRFNPPKKNPCAEYDERIWRMPPSPDRKAKRSITPPHFAQAFYEANL